ncbi:hypothetical protein CVT26_011718 [Gymnopilus dilepis]|uniref:Uncharacterized protein n=1 Tax=Gymnopilus dilepis TaxID=231916 RepID=A0A409YGX3_9AGAR|nr:hypothetical protein CVT26_011718 [Gymnopilus dilepis]
MSTEDEIVCTGFKTRREASAADILQIGVNVPGKVRVLPGSQQRYKVWYSESGFGPSQSVGTAGDLYVVKVFERVSIFWKRRRQDGREAWKMAEVSEPIFHPRNPNYFLNASRHPEWLPTNLLTKRKTDFHTAGLRFLQKFGKGNSKARPISL